MVRHAPAAVPPPTHRPPPPHPGAPVYMPKLLPRTTARPISPKPASPAPPEGGGGKELRARPVS